MLKEVCRDAASETLGVEQVLDMVETANKQLAQQGAHSLDVGDGAPRARDAARKPSVPAAITFANSFCNKPCCDGSKLRGMGGADDGVAKALFTGRLGYRACRAGVIGAVFGLPARASSSSSPCPGRVAPRRRRRRHARVAPRRRPRVRIFLAIILATKGVAATTHTPNPQAPVELKARGPSMSADIERSHTSPSASCPSPLTHHHAPQLPLSPMDHCVVLPSEFQHNWGPNFIFMNLSIKLKLVNQAPHVLVCPGAQVARSPIPAGQEPVHGAWKAAWPEGATPRRLRNWGCQSNRLVNLMKLGLDPKCEVLDLGGKHHTVVSGAEGELGSVVCERGGDKSRRGLVCEGGGWAPEGPGV